MAHVISRPHLSAIAMLGACLGTVQAIAGTSVGASVNLATADTTITLEARPEGPRLTTLELADGTRWHNRAAEPLPERVQVRGVTLPLVWQIDVAASHIDPREAVFAYVSSAPRLRLLWRWRTRAAFGPLEHDIRIENLDADDVWLPLQNSFTFDWATDPRQRLERFWIEKGADTPGPGGSHLDALPPGSRWTGASSTYARPLPGQPREMIPYVLIEDPGGAHRGWYVGIEFSGRTRIALERNGSALRGAAGLNPLPAPYRTRLVRGVAFVTPTVFLGAARGGPDAVGNILHRWVRAVLDNPHTLADRMYPLMVSNSWGSGTAVDEAQARRMILQAQQLGLEMFHLDAGWFRAVGDWRADPVKFPHGIAAIADFAHAHGLRFGLWVDWAQAGTSTMPEARNVFDPHTRDWLIADPPPGWKNAEPFKGITMDLSVPAAAAWAQRELERIVSEYHLDMLEHDGYLVAQGSAHAEHLAAPPAQRTLHVYEDAGYLWVDSSNSTDVSYHATQAYYAIYEQLRKHHPQLLLEICNDGGRMIDFGSAAHGDYFSTTDTYDPLSNRRAFFDASYVLPPAMLESYVAQGTAPRLENFRYQLRSGMLGWFSLMQDTSSWSTAQRADARVQFALYRDVLRPLIRKADLYHVSPRPDGVGWDGMEYYDRTSGRGVLYAFHGTSPADTEHRFRLLGLDSEGTYRVHSQDGGTTSGVMAGQELLQRGISVRLPLSSSSDLIFLEKVASPATPRSSHTSQTDIP
jgi:hypothetical protein